MRARKGDEKLVRVAARLVRQNWLLVAFIFHHFCRILHKEGTNVNHKAHAVLVSLSSFGNCDEFYFDGRYPGGLGMNGGIILHGNEFSVHT